MNYSRRTTKKDIGKRILISWLVIALMFTVIGFGCGWGTKAVLTKRDTKETTVGTHIAEASTYGAFKGVDFSEWEDWNAGDNNFVPMDDLKISSEIQEFTYYLSAAYEIEYSFVLALMQKESRFDIYAVSSTNDYGLMQINACNKDYLNKQLGITDLTNPYENIEGALFILRGLFDKYDNTSKVLMAYNMGEYGASKLWDKGIFETSYSKEVLENQADFIEKLNKLESEVKEND